MAKRKRTKRVTKRTRKRLLHMILIVSGLIAVLAVAGIAFWRVGLKVQYPCRYEEQVREAAAEFDVSPNMVYAIMRTESSFRPEAVSKAGAVGLMQLMPATAQEMAEKMQMQDYSIERLAEPDVNLRLGCKYFAMLRAQFGNDACALAAYNAGPNMVRRWLAQPEYSTDGATLTQIPYPETRAYVRKVLRTYEMYNQIYGAGA